MNHIQTTAQFLPEVEENAVYIHCVDGVYSTEKLEVDFDEVCEVPDDQKLPSQELESVSQLLSIFYCRIIVNVLIWLPGLFYLYGSLLCDILEQKHTILSMASNGTMKLLVTQMTYLAGIILPISFVWRNRDYLEVNFTR